MPFCSKRLKRRERARLHLQPPGRLFLPAVDSHLSHGLGQVGGDGRQAPPTTVHDVVAAGAHGRTGAGRQAARLDEGAAAVT